MSMTGEVPARTFQISRKLLIRLILVAVGIGVLFWIWASVKRQYVLAERRGHIMSLALGLEDYYREHNNTFPPSFVLGSDGKPAHSWRALMLPYFDRGDLFSRYHLDEPWDGPHNRILEQEMPSACRVPGHLGARGDVTDYVMVVGPDTPSPGSSGAKWAGVSCPAEPRCLVVELPDSGINWLEPRDMSPEQIIERVRGGAFYVSNDCSVHEIPRDATPDAIRSLLIYPGK